MASQRLTVVLSQGQSNNPAKRELEEQIATALVLESSVQVSIIPHLYDLHKDHSGLLFLSGVTGDVVVLSWLYPRGAHWSLDAKGFKGKIGTVLIEPQDAEDDFEEPEPEEDDKERIGAVDVPDRLVYCMDLRWYDDPEKYLDEIRRITKESTIETVPLQVDLGLGKSSNGNGLPKTNGEIAKSNGTKPEQSSDVSASASEPNGNGNGTHAKDGGRGLDQWIKGNPTPEQLERFHDPVKFVDDPVKRRWNPVIDYDRCTNCMECIDFCLFGVYGVDGLDRILVEEPENCKKGCPACSRVCPEQAIIFPMHKSPEIAGAATDSVSGLKIDLSQLFGGGDSMAMAAAERDAELVADGREAVGLEVGIPKRQDDSDAAPKDDLDNLMDQLDDLDI